MPVNLIVYGCDVLVFFFFFFFGVFKHWPLRLLYVSLFPTWTGVAALLYLSCVFNFYSIESKLSKINDAYCYGCFRVRCWSRARSQWKTSSIWLVMIIIVAGGRLSSRHFTISLYMSAHVLSVSLRRKDIFTIDKQDLTTNYFIYI